MAANEPEVQCTVQLAGVDGYQFSGDNATVTRKCAFIGLYREHGSIYHAAKLTPVNRKTIYRWLDADPQFAEAFADSKEDNVDELETSVYKRAFNDSILAMFYLKAYRPRFRDKVAIDMQVIDEEIRERMRLIDPSRLQLLPAMTEFVDGSHQNSLPVNSPVSIPIPDQPDNQQKED